MTVRAGRYGLRFADCRLLRVQAEIDDRPLQLDGDWPLPLDGLLAHVVRSGNTGPGIATLPLVPYREGLGNQWVWAASCLEQTTHPRIVEWRCLGHRRSVADILDRARYLTRSRTTVVGWSVIVAGPPDFDAVLWHADGRIARPIPARGAAALGLIDPPTAEAAIRPPYSIPPQSTAGVGFSRAWREVLDPNVRRPSIIDADVQAPNDAEATATGGQHR